MLSMARTRTLDRLPLLHKGKAVLWHRAKQRREQGDGRRRHLPEYLGPTFD
jgi:hypothetical protein